MGAVTLTLAIEFESDYAARRNAPGETDSFVAAVNNPVIVAGDGVTLEDGEDVIGVSVDGIDRAYCVRALTGAPHRHVVNDLIFRTPVTVTYCDLTGTVRVYRATGHGDRPLAVSLGGWRNAALLLRIAGRDYVQGTDDVPLAAVPFERSTWKSWKVAHPGSGVYLGDETGTGSASPLRSFGVPFAGMDVRLTSPGIQYPIVSRAEADVLDDNVEVLGLSITGKARAYSIAALSRGPQGHVVNDLIGQVPVTVTFCDLSGCARVFTKAESAQALDIGVGGIRGGKMILLIDGGEYAQDAHDVPLEPLQYEKTTWGRWKAAHPESDVYVGESGNGDGAVAD